MVGEEDWVTGGVERVKDTLREALLITIEAGWNFLSALCPILLAALVGIGITLGIVALTLAVLEGLL